MAVSSKLYAKPYDGVTATATGNSGAFYRLRRNAVRTVLGATLVVGLSMVARLEISEKQVVAFGTFATAVAISTSLAARQARRREDKVMQYLVLKSAPASDTSSDEKRIRYEARALLAPLGKEVSRYRKSVWDRAVKEAEDEMAARIRRRKVAQQA